VPKRTRAVPSSVSVSVSASSVDGDGSEIRVICVDDHAVLIEGLKAQFSLDRAVRCIAALPSAERLIDEARRLNPDVVLLDIEMPGPDAFETADRLHHIEPRTRVIFLSAHIRDGYIDAAFKCGAWGYFAKSDDLTDIVAGIHEVARGREGTFVLGAKVKERCKPIATVRSGARRSLATREHTAGQADRKPVTPLSTLSTREIEVLRLIGKGLSRHQIAEQLSRAVKTVDGHQARIMGKLRIATRSELMRLAIREGLAEA